MSQDSQHGQRLVWSLLGLVLVLRMWSQSVIVSERFCFMCDILGPHGVLNDMQRSLLVCIVCWGTSCSWFCPPCHQLFNRGKTRAWWWSRFKEPPLLFFSLTLVGLMDTVSVKKWIMSWATFGCGGGGGGSRAGVPTGERFGGGPDMSDTSSSSSLIPSRLNSSSLGSS